MSGKEKLYFLLNRIDDVRAIAPSGQPLIIDPMNDLNGNYRAIELSQLFTKLEKDEQVLKVLKVPSRIKEIDIVEDLDPYEHADDGCWHIELLPAFDKYFLKIQQEPEYQEFTGKKPAPLSKSDDLAQSSPKKPNSDVVYEITYTKAREILLNKMFQLAKLDFDSENDLVFNFLYEHPHQKITKKELEEGIKRKITKEFNKIVENLGFKGELRKVFFSVSGSSIYFRNPITQKDLDDFGISRIKLP